MDEDALREMSYREVQKACKEAGVSATGKREALIQRLLDAIEDTEDETENVEPEGALTPDVCESAKQRIPKTPHDLRLERAAYALEVASKTPLPSFLSMTKSDEQKERAENSGPQPQYTPGVRRPAEPKVEKNVRGGAALPVTFFIVSIIMSVMSMYSCRIDWKSVLLAARGQNLQDGFLSGAKAIQKEIQNLSKRDFVAALRLQDSIVATTQAKYYGTIEYVSSLSDQEPKAALKNLLPGVQAYLGSALSSIKRAVSPPDPTRSVNTEEDFLKEDIGCQAPVNGFKYAILSPSRAFDGRTSPDYSAALTRFLVDLSNSRNRFKSVVHLSEYPQDQDAVATAQEAMEKFGCDNELSDQCVLVDWSVLKASGNQGAALQAIASKHLISKPSSIFFMVNLQDIDFSGSAVLLTLMGEHGVLNEPSCDISTQASATVIFHPVDTSTVTDPEEVLDNFEAGVVKSLIQNTPKASGYRTGSEAIDNEEFITTAGAIRRRVSSHVLRTNPIGYTTVFDEGDNDGTKSEL